MPPPSPFPLSHHDRFQDETLLFHTRPFSPGLVDLGEDEEWGTSFGAMDSPVAVPRDLEDANTLGSVFDQEVYTGHGEKAVEHYMPSSVKQPSLPPTPPPLPPASRLSTPKDESTALTRYLAKHRQKQMDVFDSVRSAVPKQGTEVDASADTIEPTPSAQATPVRMGTVEEIQAVREIATPLVSILPTVEDTPRRSKRVQRLAVAQSAARASPRRRRLSPLPSPAPNHRTIETVAMEQPLSQVRSTRREIVDHTPPVSTIAVDTSLPEPTLESSDLPGRWPGNEAVLVEEVEAIAEVKPVAQQVSSPVSSPALPSHLESRAATPPHPSVAHLTPSTVYPQLPELSAASSSRRKSLTATVQTFFAGLVGRSASPASTSTSTSTPTPAPVLGPGPEAASAVHVNSNVRPIKARPVKVVTATSRANPATKRPAVDSTLHLESRIEKRKRRDEDLPKVTRIRLFGPEEKAQRSSRSVKPSKREPVTLHTTAPTKSDAAPSSRRTEPAPMQTAAHEPPRRPWKEAAHALAARNPDQKPKPLAASRPPAPNARPAKPTVPAPQSTSAPLQLTKPKPFAFTAPRKAPVVAIADRGPVAIKPHERATNIAARRAVFENLAKRSAPKLTVPEAGRTPGRIIRQRIEERQKFEMGLRQREEEKRKLREEADAERMRLEAAEDAQRRKETIIWAHPVPDMYRRSQNASD